MKTKTIALAICFLLFFSCFVYASGSCETYQEAVKLIKSGDTHMSFMYYRLLLTDYPNSKYTEKALIATGEYYFSIHFFHEASEAFQKVINDYPDSKARLFVLAYLYNLADKNQQEELKEKLQKELIAEQHRVFLFKDSKEVRYVSPFLKRYKAVYYIDRVEFYVDEELLAQISY